MKTSILLLLVTMLSYAMYALSIKPSYNIKKALWLIGTWENQTSKGSTFEVWNVTNNKEYFGKSYTIKEKDTIFFETVRLVKERDGLYYVPTVKNKNNDLAVRFIAKVFSENHLAFENTEHDFPQYISYTKINADSLVAEISGTKNGQKRTQTFPMKRIK